MRTEDSKGGSLQPCILIVDDQLSSIMILEHAVKGLGRIISTTEPEEVKQLIAENKPTVILMDINMGDYNGIDMVRDIKSGNNGYSPSVILVTALQDPSLEFSALKAGGIDFLQKPISGDICRLRVENLLGLKQYSKELELAKQRLHEENKNFRVTLSSIGNAVIVVDANAHVTFLNPIAEELVGISQENAIGQHIDELMFLQDATTTDKITNPAILAMEEARTVGKSLNCQLVNHHGRTYRIEESATPIINDFGEVTGAVTAFHDISKIVAMAIKMNRLANADQLTGLPNRILLNERIEQALKVSSANNQMVALLLIDIDQFKYLNKTLGHFNSDTLIKLVANRLASIISEKDTVARVGGDEFAIVVPKILSSSAAGAIAISILKAMKRPFIIAQQEHTISASIGISISPTDADDKERLMRNADSALYRAKCQGGNSLCLFSIDLEVEILNRIKLEKTLRRAVDNNLIEVVYQPQIDFATNKVIAAEALARLKGDDGQYIPPPQFISLAEELNLINELGRQILQKACEAQLYWQAQGVRIKICVNVSAKQFASSTFYQELLATVRQIGVSSSMIELELTETSLMEDFEFVIDILAKLASAGFAIAIDDFGTGYSSLAYLKHFKVNVLKIDQSFIRDMHTDELSLNIVKTIIMLASSLKLNIVGEGIEQMNQRQQLIDLGCEVGQGYLFSKPISQEEFIRFALQQNKAKTSGQ